MFHFTSVFSLAVNRVLCDDAVWADCGLLGDVFGAAQSQWSPLMSLSLPFCLCSVAVPESDSRGEDALHLASVDLGERLHLSWASWLSSGSAGLFFTVAAQVSWDLQAVGPLHLSPWWSGAAESWLITMVLSWVYRVNSFGLRQQLSGDPVLTVSLADAHPPIFTTCGPSVRMSSFSISLLGRMVLKVEL